MRLIIAGSRDIDDAELILRELTLLGWNPDVILNGMARGPDRIGGWVGEMNDVPVEEYPANWTLHGRKAGHVRNQVMADSADHLLAIWDGNSHGTRNMINTAHRDGLIVHVKVVAERAKMGVSIYVFGSNLAGRHGEGSALTAVTQWGAMCGNGCGPQGRSYAIPTKDKKLRDLPLQSIATHAKEFLVYARERPLTTFLLTQIGCGLDGYSPAQIAPMFRDAPANVILPTSFYKELKKLDLSSWSK